MRATLLSVTESLTLPCEWVEAPNGAPQIVFYPGPKVWRLTHDFEWEHEGQRFRVRAPFDFDLASVPRVVWPVIGPHELGIISPLLHDWLYRCGGVAPPDFGWLTPDRTYTRGEADRLFLSTMKREGVPWLRRNVAYAAVRAFGRGSWRG